MSCNWWKTHMHHLLFLNNFKSHLHIDTNCIEKHGALVHCRTNSNPFDWTSLPCCFYLWTIWWSHFLLFTHLTDISFSIVYICWQAKKIMLNSKEWLICGTFLELFLRPVLWKQIDIQRPWHGWKCRMHSIPVTCICHSWKTCCLLFVCKNVNLSHSISITPLQVDNMESQSPLFLHVWFQQTKIAKHCVWPLGRDFLESLLILRNV